MTRLVRIAAFAALAVVILLGGENKKKNKVGKKIIERGKKVGIIGM